MSLFVTTYQNGRKLILASDQAAAERKALNLQSFYTGRLVNVEAA